MKVGYDRIKNGKEMESDLRAAFASLDVSDVVIEPYQKSEIYPESSRLTRLINTMKPGDTLVIPSLERVSESVTTLRSLLMSLTQRSLQLEISASPSLTLTDWLEVLEWWQAPISRPKNRIISVEKESERDANQIRPLAKDPSYRELYWSIFKEIQHGASLRRTAKRLNVSQGTVLRIKRDRRKFTQTGWLIATFFVTVISLNIAQAYSTNWFLQVIICAIATVLIIYLSYSDIREND